MKKLLLFLLVFLIIGGSVFAFDILSYPPALDGGGSIMIDVGVGIPWDGIILSAFGARKMSIPPIFLDVEYAIPNIPISAGIFGAYQQDKWAPFDHYDYGWRLSIITVGAKADWHWGLDINMLDLYTGISLGYRLQWEEWYGSGYSFPVHNYSGFDYGGHVGAHFYFTKIFGAVVEAGYPFLVKAGVALKFGGGGSGGGSSGGKYIVNSDTLNVRSGPSADSSVVGVLQRNDSVNVIDKSGAWWKIKSGKIEGYVNSSYLKED